MLKRIVKITLFLSFISVVSFGQTVIGKYGGEFLAIGVGIQLIKLHFALSAASA